MKYPTLKERFFRYIQIDTQSDDSSATFPSTQKQFDLGKVLLFELQELGLTDVVHNQWGYVFATLESNQTKLVPTIALIGHLDTSPDVSGAGVKPLLHPEYRGQDLMLSAAGKVVLSPKDNPVLLEKIGKTIVTSSGDTLLGADDKAGIAAIMDALTQFVTHPDLPHPRIRVVFTPDEETGRGVEHLTVEEIDAKYGYTIDGEKLGEIEDETFCADSVEMIIRGVNVHPGMAKNKLINAVKIAAHVVEKLPKDSLSPETTEKRQGYVHPHQFTGTVEEAKIKFLIRDFEESGLKEKESFLKTILEETVSKYPPAQFEFKVTESYRNMKVVLDKYPDVLDKAEKAVAMAGLKPHRAIIRGGTDGARLSFMGLPTPNIFTGGHNFHSKLEWIALEDIEKASEVLVNLMKLWAE